MSERLEDILKTYLAGGLPANIALMRLLMQARQPSDVEGLLQHPPVGATASERARHEALRGLLLDHSGAWGTVRTVMAEAEHDAVREQDQDGVARWAGIFDRLALVAPEAGVALYALGSPDLLAAATDEVVARMRGWNLLHETTSVLEIGCGIGRLTLALAPHVAGVLGLDVSGGMIAEARRRAGNAPNVAFRTSDGRNLSVVETASVDLVLACDVFPYLVGVGPDLARIHVMEAARVLRPGGALLILNYSYRGDGERDRRDVVDAFAVSGLAVERDGTRDFALWDGVAYLGRKPAA